MIETYVVKEDLFSLEEAVYKRSGLAAETIGVHDRGLIKEGYKADLLLFDPTLIRRKLLMRIRIGWPKEWIW